MQFMAIKDFSHFNVHMNCLGILVTFRRPGVGSDYIDGFVGLLLSEVL